MTEAQEGGCLCGAVRFRVQAPVRDVVYCHCSQCRRQTGHYYAATEVADASLSVTGEATIAWFDASTFARRGFCRICGSALFWKRRESDVTSVLAGAFDQPSRLRGGMHIFVADKGDYYTIDDGLPRFQRSSDSVPVAED
jgi:hypothetical protein